MTFSDCADTTTPVYWLGRPGDLVAIRVPDQDYTRTPNDNSVVHALLGGQAVDRSLYEQRTWQMAYEILSYSTQLLIEQVRTRQRGIGPFVFIDPHTVNFLTPNQSSGTDAWLTTVGFNVTGTGESLSSSTAVTAVRGTHSLQWNLPITVTGSGGGVMMLTTSYGVSGWATPPSQGWTFIGQVQGGGTDAIVTVTPHLTWLSSTGAILSTTAGTGVNTASGSWTAFTVTGTAPSNAVWCLPRLVVTPGTVSGAAIVYVDELQLDMRVDSRGPRAWMPGQNQPRVSVLVTNEGVSRIGRTNQAYKFVELTGST